MCVVDVGLGWLALLAERAQTGGVSPGQAI